MDGIANKTEQVLTIGATNLAQELDAALLRPGRFEVVYEVRRRRRDTGRMWPGTTGIRINTTGCHIGFVRMIGRYRYVGAVICAPAAPRKSHLGCMSYPVYYTRLRLAVMRRELPPPPSRHFLPPGASARPQRAYGHPALPRQGQAAGGRRPEAAAQGGRCVRVVPGGFGDG